MRINDELNEVTEVAEMETRHKPKSVGKSHQIIHHLRQHKII